MRINYIKYKYFILLGLKLLDLILTGTTSETDKFAIIAFKCSGNGKLVSTDVGKS